MATVRVVTVVKFVRINKRALVLVFGIGLKELVCEVASQRLIVHRTAALLHIGEAVPAPHSWRIVPNGVVRDFVLVFDSKLLLVAPARQDICI